MKYLGGDCDREMAERRGAACRERLRDADLRKVQRVDAWIDMAETEVANGLRCVVMRVSI